MTRIANIAAMNNTIVMNWWWRDVITVGRL